MTQLSSDNQVIAAIIKLINDGFAFYRAQGVEGYAGTFLVMQKNQPTRQGIPKGPAVFIEKLFDRRHGFQGIAYKALPDGTQLQVERQVTASTFQLTVRSMQFPGVNAPTASDVLSVVAGFVQSRKAVDTLQAGGAGILRVVSNLTNGYLQDDQDRPEAGPSFDIVITYTRETPVQIVGTVGSVSGSTSQLPEGGN